jgi:hypothetical protein
MSTLASGEALNGRLRLNWKAELFLVPNEADVSSISAPPSALRIVIEPFYRLFRNDQKHELQELARLTMLPSPLPISVPVFKKKRLFSLTCRTQSRASLAANGSLEVSRITLTLSKISS